MSSVTLTKRLAAILDLVPDNSLVSDIGTDHALLPIKLIQTQKCNKVIASDIVDGPLAAAKRNIASYNLEKHIEVVKSDGLLNVISFKPETIVIAGMGGETIVNILSAVDYPKKSVPTLILQPMTHCEKVRKYLYENGFTILNEKVVREDNRFYVILVTRFLPLHQKNLISSDILAELGEIGVDTEECGKDYLIWRRGVVMSALIGLKNTENKAQTDYFTALLNEIDNRLK